MTLKDCINCRECKYACVISALDKGSKVTRAGMGRTVFCQEIS